MNELLQCRKCGERKAACKFSTAQSYESVCFECKREYEKRKRPATYEQIEGVSVKAVHAALSNLRKTPEYKRWIAGWQDRHAHLSRASVRGVGVID